MKSVIFTLSLIALTLSAIGQECSTYETRLIELIRASRPTETSLVDFETQRSAAYDSLGMLLQKTNCHSLLSAAYRERGKAFANMGKYEKAMESQRMSLTIAQKVDSAFSIASAFNSIAKLHYRAEQKDSALFYFKEALKSYRRKGSKSGQLLALQNIAENHFGLQEYDSAEVYCQELHVLASEHGYTEGVIVADQIRLNSRMIESGPTDSILNGLRDCAQRFEEIEDFESLCTVYENIGSAYEERNELHEAIRYYRLSIEDPCDEIDFYHLQFMSRKIASLSSLQNEKNILMERQGRTRNALLLALTLLLLAIGFTAYFMIKSRNQKAALAQEEVNRLIKDQELQSIEAMLQGQDLERKRIAEELHDRLGGMLATLKLHYSAVEEQVQALQSQVRAQYDQAGQLIDETAQEVRRISHDLYSGVLVKFGLSAALEQLASAMDQVDEPTFHWHLPPMEERLNTEQEINLYRIVQECITNILKHAKANEVTIQLNRVDDRMILMIEDDGVGFEVEKFNGQGIGLQNIRSRVKRMNGTLSIDSTLDRGTTFIIEIPLDT